MHPAVKQYHEESLDDFKNNYKFTVLDSILLYARDASKKRESFITYSFKDNASRELVESVKEELEKLEFGVKMWCYEFDSFLLEIFFDRRYVLQPPKKKSFWQRLFG